MADPAARRMQLLMQAPFLPTPDDVVSIMLSMAEPEPGELLFDLGCGDGRILIEAARRYRVRAVGVELDPGLAHQARENARRAGVLGLVEVLEADLFLVDLSKADIVVAFLSPTLMRLLGLKLRRELKPGARVVCHDYPLPGWQPAETREVPSGRIHVHRIFLYRI